MLSSATAIYTNVTSLKHHLSERLVILQGRACGLYSGVKHTHTADFLHEPAFRKVNDCGVWLQGGNYGKATCLNQYNAIANSDAALKNQNKFNGIRSRCLVQR
jgi:hypothetical protein